MLEELEFLDAPRKALWNLGRGLKGLVRGDADLADLLPGLLGGGLTAGLAATGVGLPLALLGGSVLGGAGQEAFGKEATSPSDVMKGLGIDPESGGGMVGSFALSALTDPLTYAGIGVPAKALAREAQAAKGLRGIGAAIPVEEALGKAEAAGGLVPRSADPTSAFLEMDPHTKGMLLDLQASRMGPAEKLTTENAIWENKLDEVTSLMEKETDRYGIQRYPKNQISPELSDAINERHLRLMAQRALAEKLGIDASHLTAGGDLEQLLTKQSSAIGDLTNVTGVSPQLRGTDLDKAREMLMHDYPTEKGLVALKKVAPDLGFENIGYHGAREMMMPAAIENYLGRTDEMWRALIPEELARDARTLPQMLETIQKDEGLMRITPQEFISGMGEKQRGENLEKLIDRMRHIEGANIADSRTVDDLIRSVSNPGRNSGGYRQLPEMPAGEFIQHLRSPGFQSGSEAVKTLGDSDILYQRRLGRGEILGVNPSQVSTRVPAPAGTITRDISHTDGEILNRARQSFENPTGPVNLPPGATMEDVERLIAQNQATGWDDPFARERLEHLTHLREGVLDTQRDIDTLREAQAYYNRVHGGEPLPGGGLLDDLNQRIDHHDPNALVDDIMGSMEDIPGHGGLQERLRELDDEIALEGGLGRGPVARRAEEPQRILSDFEEGHGERPLTEIRGLLEQLRTQEGRLPDTTINELSREIAAVTGNRMNRYDQENLRNLLEANYEEGDPIHVLLDNIMDTFGENY